jgi:hypothetical protein
MNDNYFFITCYQSKDIPVLRSILFEHFKEAIKSFDKNSFTFLTGHKIYTITDYEIMIGKYVGYRPYKVLTYSYRNAFKDKTNYLSDERIIELVLETLKELINKEKQHVDTESK